MLGAIQINLPLFIPKTPQVCYLAKDTNPSEYLDINQNVVTLGNSHIPFIRFIAHSTSITVPVKRYFIGDSYAENITGGQPLRELVCTYDIVTHMESQMTITESISALLVTITKIESHCQIDLIINHLQLFELLLDMIGPSLNLSQRNSIMTLLRISRITSWNFNSISKLYNIEVKILDALALMDVRVSSSKLTALYAPIMKQHYAKKCIILLNL